MTDAASAQLSQKQFEKIKERLYGFCGINLNSDKQNLVKARLTKRLAAVKLTTFDEYLSFIEKDRTEFSHMIDALTTNKTNFFRERQHFDYLRENILPKLRSKRLRIWSAACSSGEEPYSISMLLHDSIPDIGRWDFKILATDISGRILQKASCAAYAEESLSGISAAQRQKYLTRTNDQHYRIRDEIRKPIKFARLNLMEKWPMRGPFDVIFCRNVMIYFDKPTQSVLVNRFYDLLDTGNHLFVGHSESLTSVDHRFAYVQPAVYLK
jgi:chemotaxis protein methyltransferase CheR